MRTIKLKGMISANYKLTCNQISTNPLGTEFSLKRILAAGDSP